MSLVIQPAQMAVPVVSTLVRIARDSFNLASEGFQKTPRPSADSHSRHASIASFPDQQLLVLITSRSFLAALRIPGLIQSLVSNLSR
jgi:hypothetical protein